MQRLDETGSTVVRVNPTCQQDVHFILQARWVDIALHAGKQQVHQLTEALQAALVGVHQITYNDSLTFSPLAVNFEDG